MARAAPPPSMRPMKSLALLFAAALLAGCATAPPAADLGPKAAERPCDAALPAGTRCYVGRDSAGAYYGIAIPPGWDAARGALVVHAHGGPDLEPASERRVLADMKRWAITPKAGHAWVGSSYRRGGYGWTMAGEDVERSRALFVRDFGTPRRTLLHGQSYGGGVAAKLAEAPAGKNYDGVLLTNSMLGGGRRFLEFRFDLRTVYQHYCNNHPRPDEPQYPLWMGLPADSKMDLRELTARIDECTGVRKPAAQRTEQQKARLANILNVIKIREDYLVRHMEQATWLFRDLTQERLGGRNPFSNMGALYRGSSDDNALNAAVQRHAADRLAVGELARDSEPQGRVPMPVLTLHAIGDPTAFVELEAHYRQVLERGGSADRLVQVFTEDTDHSYLDDPEYPAAFTALLDWIDRGEKPTPAKVAASCLAGEARYGKGCNIQPAYQPAAIDTRVTPRPR
jgi:alpha-beta hydrolase superfamily lysophospholipase